MHLNAFKKRLGQMEHQSEEPEEKNLLMTRKMKGDVWKAQHTLLHHGPAPQKRGREKGRGGGGQSPCGPDFPVSLTLGWQGKAKATVFYSSRPLWRHPGHLPWLIFTQHSQVPRVRDEARLPGVHT